MNTAHDHDVEDHGDDLGPAFHARHTELVRIEGKLKNSAQRDAPVVARRVLDATLFDKMHRCGQLSDRQHTAGIRLHKLFVSAGLLPRTTARIPSAPMPGHDDDEMTNEEPRTRDECLFEHRSLMRGVPAQAASLLDAACLWEPDGYRGGHPGVRWLATFQAALDDLADRWEIPREGI